MKRIPEIAVAVDQLCEGEAIADRHCILGAITAVRKAVIAVGATLAPGSTLSAEVLDAFSIEIYPRLKSAYQSAGYPCGPGDEALWQWLRQLAAIAAESERVELERAWQRGLAALQRAI